MQFGKNARSTILENELLLWKLGFLTNDMHCIKFGEK